jgi:dolichol-phosphate mannosyltransferase
MGKQIDSIDQDDYVPKYDVHRFGRKKSQTALVIPIINEGERIILQLERINLISPEVDIIIADGGSDDGTLQRIIGSKIQITSFLEKKDKGKLSAQLLMGFDFCLSEGYQYVITMDGNNKDDEKGIEVIQKALTSGYDFVQGSRFVNGGKAVRTPLIRLLAIRLIHAPITSMASCFWFTDTTNGFRGHSALLLRNQKLSIFREVFETYELIAYLPIQSRRLGFNVVEVPVTRTYPATGTVPTKIKGIKSLIALMKILFMASLGKYSPKIPD